VRALHRLGIEHHVLDLPVAAAVAEPLGGPRPDDDLGRLLEAGAALDARDAVVRVVHVGAA